MTLPVSSLANMEYALYGGLGATNCPSIANGYNSFGYNNPYLQNPYFQYPYASYPYNGVNYPYQSEYSKGTQSSTSSTGSNTTAKPVSQDALATLSKFYVDAQTPSESLTGAVLGGGAFALMTNQRFLAHPINSFKSLPAVERMFKAENLKELWKNPETHNLMTDAYARMHKLEGAAKWRAYPLFKKNLNLLKDIDGNNIYEVLKKEMEAALKSGDKDAIAKATEKIRIATNAKTGIIPRAWNSARKWLNPDAEIKTLADKLADEKAITSAVEKNLVEKGSKTLGSRLKAAMKSCKGGNALFMAGVELFFDFDKIKSAFGKDTETGMKQLGQTGVKAAGTMVGWAAGEAVGAWAGAKLGAVVGSTVCPGLGTAIGAVAGLIGGSVGAWLLGKATHKIVGQDVGAKVQAEELTKSKEGQVQLLQQVVTKAQSGEQVPQNVMFAAEQLASQVA